MGCRGRWRLKDEGDLVWWRQGSGEYLRSFSSQAFGPQVLSSSLLFTDSWANISDTVIPHHRMTAIFHSLQPRMPRGHEVRRQSHQHSESPAHSCSTGSPTQQAWVQVQLQHWLLSAPVQAGSRASHTSLGRLGLRKRAVGRTQGSRSSQWEPIAFSEQHHPHNQRAAVCSTHTMMSSLRDVTVSVFAVEEGSG